MTVEKLQLDREIFKQAVQLSPEQRCRFVDQACGENDDLKQEVESLLAAHDAASNFMSQPAITGDATTLHRPPITEESGTVIGPYKLLQQIGEGGMGVVFMAEQSEPIHRTVAIKIIKPGMDSRQVIARFEAERQAVAMMDHPNIAKVLDAGTTESGRPYFVMELVKGVPVTKYCDDKHLSLRERLELFVQVCNAVQHAHQKGIIHRDLKPTNVLIAEYDNHAVPKIIDFGVAKATAQKLTERTMFTEFGQVLGTIEYMSPEQAKLNQLDIDTRSDIYSLGVLLYELLTGSTPFDRDRLRSAAFDEVLRIIRDEEPPGPSTRLSTADKLPSIAANRHTEPGKLSRDIRGELDWIVMCSLEKDRNRRYQTANALCEDLQRYLTDQPVVARPATRTYRLKKFIRRNRASVLAASAIISALVIGLAAASYFAASAYREAQNAARALKQAERDRNNAEGINRFFSGEVFGLADPKRFNRAGLSLVEALDIASSKIDKKFPDDDALRAEIRDRLGEVYSGIDQNGRAAEQLREAVSLRTALFGDDHPSTLTSRSNLGIALYQIGNFHECRDLLRDTWGRQTSVLGAGHPDTVSTAQRLSLVLMEIGKAQFGFGEKLPESSGDLEVARSGYHAALQNLGPLHPATLRIENQLGWSLRWRKKNAEALPLAEEAARGMRKVAGDDDSETLFARFNYASCLWAMEQYDAAATEFRSVLEIRKRLLGRTHFHTLCTDWILVRVLIAAGNHKDALVVLRDVHSNLSEIKKEAGLLRTEKTNAFAPLCNKFNEFALAADFVSAAAEMASIPPADETRTHFYANILCEIATNMCSFPASTQLNNFQRAVTLAEKAVDVAPNNPRCWRTLAVAHYRAGNWQMTLDAVDKANSLQPAGDARNWFYQAMAQWKLGRNDEARRSYDKALQRIKDTNGDGKELAQEATELIDMKQTTNHQPETTSPKP